MVSISTGTDPDLAFKVDTEPGPAYQVKTVKSGNFVIREYYQQY